MIRLNWTMVLCAAAVTLALAGGARGDDSTTDNPTYQSWSKFKAGTLVKYSTEVNAMGNATSTETTKTLKDINPDKATVEVKTSMVVGGNKMDLPVSTEEVPAKIKKVEVASTQTADAPKVDTSTEDVKVGDKTYSCKKLVSNSEANGMKTKATTWTCDDVPGEVVKMEAETSGSMTASTKMTLTDFQPQQ
jgi:hypothetical protein